jgi:hypothetical protein
MSKLGSFDVVATLGNGRQSWWHWNHLHHLSLSWI